MEAQAEFEALRARAAAVDAEAAPPLPPEPAEPEKQKSRKPPEPDDDHRRAGALVTEWSTGALVGKYPKLETVWNQEQKSALAEHLAWIFAKYKLGTPTWLEYWEHELMLAYTLALLIDKSMRVIRGEPPPKRAPMDDAVYDPKTGNLNPKYDRVQEPPPGADRNWRPSLNPEAAA